MKVKAAVDRLTSKEATDLLDIVRLVTDPATSDDVIGELDLGGSTLAIDNGYALTVGTGNPERLELRHVADTAPGYDAAHMPVPGATILARVPGTEGLTGFLVPADAEGVLATWFVSEGARVTPDQLLAEVQVDKVSADVVAPSAGVVHLLVDEDSAVRQGTPIARID